MKKLRQEEEQKIHNINLLVQSNKELTGYISCKQTKRNFLRDRFKIGKVQIF